MKVIPIRPRGFCPGVVKAVKIVEGVLNNPAYPRPIQILGMIVHNRHVVDDFTSKGVITLEGTHESRHEMISKVVPGTVIITAHGISDLVYHMLKDLPVVIVDATCKDVSRTQKLVKEHLSKNHEIIYIGKRNHPETESVSELSSKVHVIETLDDFNEAEFLDKQLFVTNQTTFSIRDIETILSGIQKIYPNAIISDEICDSTRIRQEAILEANKDVDLCFIVGDPKSNNTQNLVKLSIEETNTLTYLIESEKDIKKEMLFGVKTVTVSSGASTPNSITKRVIDYLNSINIEE